MGATGDGVGKPSDSDKMGPAFIGSGGGVCAFWVIGVAGPSLRLAGSGGAWEPFRYRSVRLSNVPCCGALGPVHVRLAMVLSLVARSPATDAKTRLV